MMRLITSKLMKFRTFSTSNVIAPNTFTRFAQFASNNPTFFKDAIEKQNKENPNLKMVALELENGMKWPSFEEGVKQYFESLPHLYFHRFDEFDEIRYERTFGRLTYGYHVAWLGTPGIGKSK